MEPIELEDAMLGVYLLWRAATHLILRGQFPIVGELSRQLRIESGMSVQTYEGIHRIVRESIIKPGGRH